jgi:hypothetical protein
MKSKRTFLRFLLVGIVAFFLAQECWQHAQQAYIGAVITSSCAYTWLPERMAQHRQQSAPVVSQYLLESHLWTGAGWSLIALDGFLLILFTRAHRNQVA